MKIIINGKHTEKLAAALWEAEKRCTARTLTVGDVEKILEDIDKRLKIPKAAMKGIKLHYTGAEKFPSAYKYTPESTHFTAEHNGRFWCITNIYRYTCPNHYANTELTLTETAREAIIKNFDAFTI